jgi:hypothetical protein
MEIYPMIRAVRCLLLAMVVAAVAQLLSETAEARTVRLFAPGGGEVRALIVGINEYSARSIPTLKGAVADARDLEATLRSAGVGDMAVLIDRDATRRNFEAAINRLVDVSKGGDLVIISFAGHGSQEPELVKGSETDGMDEIFLLSDFGPTKPRSGEKLIDDEMNHWLSQLNKKQVDVLYVADTCHGGGMLREPDFRSGQLSFRDGGKITVSLLGDEAKPISTVADATLTPDDLPNVTFLAAVDKFSKAPEVAIPGNQTLRGALSYAIARSINEGNEGAVTRGQLFGFSRQIAYQYSQTKQIIATEPIGSTAKLDKVVFRLKVSGEADIAPANDVVRLRISGGDARPEIRPGRFQFRIAKSGEDADVVWDVAKGDVLNGYGDVISQSATANDVPAIVDEVGAVLAITKMSETGRLQSMKLLPDDRRFHRGEVVRFHIEDLSGKYLILVNLSGNGRVRFLYPRLRGDAALIADPFFDLRLKVEEPFGSDHVIAIVSNTRLEQAEAAISALDDQRAAGKFVDILRSIQLSDRSVRFGMAASFTAQ